jgi:hypothetical protein
LLLLMVATGCARPVKIPELPIAPEWPGRPSRAIGVSPELPRATLWLGFEPAVQREDAPDEAELVNAARRALLAHAATLGADNETELQPAAVHAGGVGANIVQFRQRIGGAEVFHARINVALDDAAQVMAVTGGFSARAGVRQAGAFTLGGADAILAALDAAGLPAPPNVSRAKSADEWEYFDVADSSSFRARRPTRAKRVWFPAEQRLIPAWYLELVGTRLPGGHPEAMGYVVSAEDGRLLFGSTLLLDAFKYRVFADPAKHPYADPYGHTNPHPTGTADRWRPTVPAPMNLIQLDFAGVTARDPWLPSGAGETAGNNTVAFFKNQPVVNGVYANVADWNFDAAAGDFRAPTTGTGSFDYPYDVNAALSDYFQIPGTAPSPVPSASGQLNAKIVQAFYAANWLHDVFYDAGFDEASGNHQNDNLGRGGIGGDPLNAIAGYVTTMAFGPEDGDSAAIRLGLNRFSLTRRDVSGFDFGVVAHEWTHTMFHRLTDMDFPGQQGALNEGTADFVGALLTVQESHRNHSPAGPFHGAYAFGAYNNLDYDMPGDTVPAAGTAGNPDNTYYHGIRRFPYSADMLLNPLTFRHIAYGAPLPTGYTPFDWKWRSHLNVEEHSAGEVWASALWQCAIGILGEIGRLKFDVARWRVLYHLVAGLKLMPTDPTFTEARDSILFAIDARDRRGRLRALPGRVREARPRRRRSVAAARLDQQPGNPRKLQSRPEGVVLGELAPRRDLQRGRRRCPGPGRDRTAHHHCAQHGLRAPEPRAHPRSATRVGLCFPRRKHYG